MTKLQKATLIDKKYIIVGGNPKGHDIAFSSATMSGMRLRPTIEASPFKVEVMDLWVDQKAEDEGKIDGLTEMLLHKKLDDGWEILAAGRWVYGALRHHAIPSTYVRHPAARTRDPAAPWRAILLPALVIDTQRYLSIDRDLRTALESGDMLQVWSRVKELAGKGAFHDFLVRNLIYEATP